MMWTKDYKVGFPPKTCVGGEFRENIPTAKGVSYKLYYITQFDLIVILEIWWQEIPCRLEVGHNTERFI